MYKYVLKFRSAHFSTPDEQECRHEMSAEKISGGQQVAHPTIISNIRILRLWK